MGQGGSAGSVDGILNGEKLGDKRFQRRRARQEQFAGLDCGKSLGRCAVMTKLRPGVRFAPVKMIKKLRVEPGERVRLEQIMEGKAV